MKIYTKTGDQGMTSLYGGARLPKHHIRIEAYGTVDELNAWVGLLRDGLMVENHRTMLKEIQDRLFTIGANLASEPGQNMPTPDITPADISRLELEIDLLTNELEPLKHFVLPGGHRLVSEAHITRTICRRAERRIMALHEQEAVEILIITYINRLSDYFFVLSRWIAKDQVVKEIKWQPRSS
ncbi:MAG: cob(I)yrinic acid a,c-diamide adenosyltransferase [Saprospiraceae bacterium]|nr:cob(I)yrinic acid a,c-diamide adenosyltransferase [Saprospiraceae bacterium]